MWKDPIVEEMREAGRQIAEEEGYDIHLMAERFRREQVANAKRVVQYDQVSRISPEPH